MKTAGLIFRDVLTGLFIFPALLGALVLFHTVIDEKKHNGVEITNRISRLELFWLSINRPGMFCGSMPWVCSNIKEKHDNN